MAASCIYLFSIYSSWRFVHKDKTVFGDELWLSVFGLKKMANEDVASSELFDIVESPTVSLVSLATGEVSTDEDTLNASKYEDLLYKYVSNSIKPYLYLFNFIIGTIFMLAVFTLLTGGCPIVIDRDDVSSIASDDSFVVVIPDCFEPSVPLLNQSPKLPVNIVQQQAPPTVQEHQQQLDDREYSVNLMTFEEPVVSSTQPVRPTGLFDTHTAATVVSKPAVLESSKPPPVTPKQMIANPRTHIWGKNPFQVAAGFIDGAMHQLDTRVGQPSGVYATATPKTTTAPKHQPSSTTNQTLSPMKQPSAPPMMAACNDTANTDDDEEFKVTTESNVL